jgi:hypothetical protein
MAKPFAPSFRPAVTPLEDRAVPAAFVQFIQNSPYPAGAALDIYVNNTLPAALTNVQFRSATPFLVEDTSNPVFVSIRPTGAAISTPPVFNRSYNFADNSTNILVAGGDPAAAATAANHFDLVAVPNARRESATVGRAEYLFVNGSPDAQPLDVKLRGLGTQANDIASGTADTTYHALPAGPFTLDVTAADGVPRIGSYAGDASKLATSAVTILASGFANPQSTGASAANSLGLLAVEADGTTTLLPAAPQNPLLTQFAAGAQNTGPATYNFDGSVVGVTQPANGRSQERVAVADVNGDGKADLVTGSGPGTASQVTVTLSTATGAVVTTQFQPFESTFTGGVFVAAGDLDGDGKADVIVTPDQGGGPVVAIYSGAKLAAGMTGDAAQLTRFLGIDDPAFRGGARAAAGDVNADGRADLAVAAGFGGGPRLAIYDGRSVAAPVAAGSLPPKLTADFFVFEQTLRNGVYVALGDVSGDGYADVIVGGGPGGGPRVLAVSGRDLVATPTKQTPVGNFFAGDTANRDGVRVAAKDLDGDQFADIVVGLGSPGSPQVRGYAGKNFAASVTPGTAPTPISALDLNPFTNPGVVYVG